MTFNISLSLIFKLLINHQTFFITSRISQVYVTERKQRRPIGSSFNILLIHDSCLYTHRKELKHQWM